MSNRTQVVIEFTDTEWSALEAAASLRGIDVAMFVHHAAVVEPPKFVEPKPKYSRNRPERVDTLLAKIARMHAVGFTDAAIAKELRCSISTVYKKRKALGLSPNTGRSHAVPESKEQVA